MQAGLIPCICWSRGRWMLTHACSNSKYGVWEERFWLSTCVYNPVWINGLWAESCIEKFCSLTSFYISCTFLVSYLIFILAVYCRQVNVSIPNDPAPREVFALFKSHFQASNHLWIMCHLQLNMMCGDSSARKHFFTRTITSKCTQTECHSDRLPGITLNHIHKGNQFVFMQYSMRHQMSKL